MIKAIFFVVGMMAICGLNLEVQAAEALQPPRYVEVRGLEGFRYWFLRHLVFDIDHALQDQGIESTSCTFRQVRPEADFSYKETGKCLMKSFLKAMESDEYPGTVYVWFRDSQGLYHFAEIKWRPPRGGWSSLIRQLYELKFEKSLYWIREKVWGAEASEKVRFQEFILGDLEIILPQDPDALAVLSENGNVWVKKYLKQIESVTISMKTTEKPKGQMIYSGPAIVRLKSPVTNETIVTEIQLKTNINVLLTDRPFFIRSKIQTQGNELIRMGATP